MASKAEDMVLAVNMPPQEPAPGQALHSTRRTCSSSMVPATRWPTASNTETTVRSSSLPGTRPGLMVPP